MVQARAALEGRHVRGRGMARRAGRAEPSRRPLRADEVRRVCRCRCGTADPDRPAARGGEASPGSHAAMGRRPTLGERMAAGPRTGPSAPEGATPGRTPATAGRRQPEAEKSQGPSWAPSPVVGTRRIATHSRRASANLIREFRACSGTKAMQKRMGRAKNRDLAREAGSAHGAVRSSSPPSLIRDPQRPSRRPSPLAHPQVLHAGKS